MKRSGRHFNIAASARRWAEAVRVRSSSRKCMIVLDVIFVAFIFAVLALDLVVEIVQLLGVCLLVGKGSNKRLKAEKPVCGI